MNIKSELNEIALSELETVVRKNTENSRCIDVFFELLHEISGFNDGQFVNLVVSDCFKMITEMFEIFKEADKVSSKRIKSRMLTKEFINPDRFFKNIDIDEYVIGYTGIYCAKYMSYTKVNRNDTEMLLNSIIHRYINPDAPYYRLGLLEGIFLAIKTHSKVSPSESDLAIKLADYQEISRKIVVLYDYIPAITKALLQTKRRSLNMDMNSKRFGKNK